MTAIGMDGGKMEEKEIVKLPKWINPRWQQYRIKDSPYYQLNKHELEVSQNTLFVSLESHTERRLKAQGLIRLMIIGPRRIGESILMDKDFLEEIPEIERILIEHQ